MIPAKIRLSPAELELVTQSEWILTKNRVMEKAQSLLGLVLEMQQDWLKLQTPHLPDEVMNIPGKISKGENYKGLPYLVLDHPRFFEKENVFAIRTMFWWGNFFSVTLQLSGNYRINSENNWNGYYAELSSNGFYIAVHESAWEHHFEKDNYLPVSAMSKEEFGDLAKSKSYFKLAKKFSLNEWDEIPGKLMECFVQLFGYATQLPRR